MQKTIFVTIWKKKCKTNFEKKSKLFFQIKFANTFGIFNLSLRNGLKNSKNYFYLSTANISQLNGSLRNAIVSLHALTDSIRN